MGVRAFDICLASLALYLVGRLIWRRRTPLPPGPPGWPLIGNLFTQNTVIAYATPGLEKKSAITSNRPHFTMGGDLVGWRDGMFFLQYGDTYRTSRKYFHRQIGTKSSLAAFHPAETAEAKQFLCNVLKSPDDLVAHSRRLAGSVILKISHGYTVKEDGDPLVEMANNAMHNFSVITTPGRFLVDMLPI